MEYGVIKVNFNFIKTLKITTSVAVLGILALHLTGVQAKAISLEEAVAVAIESNPEIGQAVENREAIEFELRQARGLFLPSVDFETSAGGRRLGSPSSRASFGFAERGLAPVEASLTITQTLYNGGQRRAELERQASRVDSASLRVLERSSAIGLQVVREYLEYLLQARIINEASANLRFHYKIQSSIQSGIKAGTLTDADAQQVRERILAAKARLKEAEENLIAAGIRFLTLVGKPVDGAHMPSSVKGKIPHSLAKALGSGRDNNDRIKIAKADLDVTNSLVKAAEGGRKPEIFLEGRSRIGNDIDGSNGRTSDLQARVVARWNLYRGGIDRASKQEQIRRVSEQRLVLHQTYRQVDEAIRISWDRRIRQTSLANTLRRQAEENGRLVSSYREQFGVGQRSLLDVLDAQNTRFNVNIRRLSADFAALFTDYQVLAASGLLLKSLNLKAPQQSDAYARAEFDVPASPPTETYARVPSRQQNKLPMDLLAPLKRKY